MRRVWLVLGVMVVVGLAVGVAASAHIERASYWPDPAPDTSVSPPAGGKVPAARSLRSSLLKRPPGHTRVVCSQAPPSRKAIRRAKSRLHKARRHHASRKRIRALKRRVKKAGKRWKKRMARNRSIRKLNGAIARARKHGYKYRPSEKARRFTKKRGRNLKSVNLKLLARCKYRSIQRAVTRSHNNDRVVVLPGTYTEPNSRAKPTNDPKCASLRQQNDRQTDNGANQTGAVSYAYQVKCPNDQNLIAVMGRKNGKGKDPQPPRDDRHGIPNLGPCVRCNFQIEGSGVTADGVIIDAGRVASGNHGPIGAKKDVGLRADRADGFVMRNMTIRHAKEHDLYILESDGYRAERFKTFYGGEYGVLTFVEDHGLIQDCEAAGSGDSGLYPGAGADTGAQTVEKTRRYSQEIRNCDTHHNTSGYSGTDGNAVHLHDNRLYDNALGFTTDVFTAAGHPGFPQDSDLIERNDFYSNNFNPYAKGSDVQPTVPVPVGTGLWIAGGNENVVRNNHFWNNWRRGAMLFAVPDATVCAPPEHQAACNPATTSTSYRNRFYGNSMGRTPGGKTDSNGTDFWWDSFANNTGNCWYGNKGKAGTAASVTSVPGNLPSNCGTSRGLGGVSQEAELGACLADFDYLHTGVTCNWFKTPPEPKP